MESLKTQKVETFENRSERKEKVLKEFLFRECGNLWARV
jgi:hypothetical protein